MTGLIITWIVTTITFIILTKLPTGIESESFGKTAIAALVFGLLNGLTGWFINSLFINVLSLGLVFLIGNTILFGLAALLVPGFRLRWGIISALLGGLGVAVINGILFKILAGVL
ncbi:phage holin family protein [Leptolyngbya sp. BC1307]|uniref:phage holin family protein n=1 Tax=Leptolyngbya sp. BC1307 TaxID=2029589 RepID=UPI000EFAFDE5|nr:phage holin family protein [Leptolyngbya sp. BC1307]